MISIDELNIKYGMINFGECSQEAIDSLRYLKSDTADLKKRYIALGFHLDEFNCNKYYMDFGYDNLIDFCLDNLDLEKTMVSRIMGVWQRFAKKNGLIRTMFIDDNFADYSFTQLTEMLPLPDDKLKMITPSMTCKDIRDFKKDLKGNKEKEVKENIPFDALIENGTLLSELVNVLEKFYKEHDVYFSPPTITAKQIFFKFNEETYKIMLVCPKKEK